MSNAIEAPSWKGKLWYLKGWWYRRVSRRFPRLVWPGDEVDVLVTFTEARLPKNMAIVLGDAKPALALMREGHLAQVEYALAEIGVTFDKGVGPEGRDWEWDFSLKGPISVTFKRKHRGGRHD